MQSILTYPTPWFGFIVVKGYDAISTSARVAALKKVDFQTLGFPISPMSIK